MRRRDYLKLSAGLLAQAGFARPALSSQAAAAPRTPIVNGAEHAWVIHDPRFAPDPRLSNCPGNVPNIDYSREHLLADMRTYSVDKCMISHVCYYGTNNSYTSYCVRTRPDKFAGIGLLVGFRLYSPADPENPSRLERLMKQDHLVGLRLSPIYDRDVVWLNDPVSYPLWKKAEELGAVFNVFLAPHQISQVGDMAKRFPGVKHIIDHFAMMDITRPASEGIEPLLGLAKHPNVYMRTSLHNPSKEPLPHRDMWPYLRRVYDQFGPRRMIYANFAELLIMKDLIPFFSAEDKEWILGKTALGVYRFQEDRKVAA